MDYSIKKMTNQDLLKIKDILISDFESLEALEKYKLHPAHVAVGDFMRPVRVSRTCIDYNI